jgi:nicotinamide-nucleotide amidase
MSDAELARLAAALGERLAGAGLRLVTAESCTGGWIAKCVTDIAGSSDWLDRGFVTYSNAAKQELLGVAAETLAAHGAVSEPVVREMVTGAVAHSSAQVAVAVSGVAGPGGGSAAKPVGMVCFGFALPGGISTETRHFAGGRDDVRREAVAYALSRLTALLK